MASLVLASSLLKESSFDSLGTDRGRKHCQKLSVRSQGASQDLQNPWDTATASATSTWGGFWSWQTSCWREILKPWGFQERTLWCVRKMLPAERFFQWESWVKLVASFPKPTINTPGAVYPRNLQELTILWNQSWWQHRLAKNNLEYFWWDKIVLNKLCEVQKEVISLSLSHGDHTWPQCHGPRQCS